MDRLHEGNTSALEYPAVEETTVSEGFSTDRRNFLKTVGLMGAGGLLASALPIANAMAATPMQCSHKNGCPCPKCKPDHAGAVSLGANPMLLPMATGDTLTPMDFTSRLATVEGLSKTQLEKHLGLYQGYVAKHNDLSKQLLQYSPEELGKANATYHPFREQSIELTYALNGTVLHELYFENIGGERAQPTEAVKAVMSKAFGTWETYTQHVVAGAKAARGWLITAYNFRDGKIYNYVLDMHNQWVPFYVSPLLVLDVYEHAYMIDFATNRGAYLDAFMKNIDWSVVDRRLTIAQYHSHSHHTPQK